MGAKIFKKTLYSVGHYYFPEEVAEIRIFLKLISTQQKFGGHYYLYRHRKTEDFWILGPHRPTGKIMFYYLGQKELIAKSSNFSNEFHSMIQDFGAKFWSAILPVDSFEDLDKTLIIDTDTVVDRRKNHLR